MKHCLVVDNSRVIRTIACQILEGMKFYAEEAADDASALESCRVQMPDAILLDLSNAGCVEFLRSLRKSKSEKQPIVVFSTIENDVQQIREALSAGADEYVMKPFDREALECTFAQAGLI
jgi:two-component system chemotaxis response regulator CheY